MNIFRIAAIAACVAMIAPSPASAGVGDLLVAPTRIVLNGSRGTEIVLSNIGDEVATYRISVELRRMKPDGTLEDVPAANDREKAAQDMILYAPRRVTIAPGQPQTIRIAARAPQGLADGEYGLRRQQPRLRKMAASAGCKPASSTAGARIRAKRFKASLLCTLRVKKKSPSTSSGRSALIAEFT